MSEHTLDTRGLLCPMPVIKTQNAIRKLTVGDRLTVLATDPGVLHDIPAWCRINGHKIIDQGQQNREISILIEVCDA